MAPQIKRLALMVVTALVLMAAGVEAAPEVHSFTLDPHDWVSEGSAAYRMTDGLVFVTFASSDPEQVSVALGGGGGKVTMPDSVTVRRSTGHARFTMTVVTGAAPGDLTISAKTAAGTVTKTRALKVQRNEVQSVSYANAVEGHRFRETVCLQFPAAQGVTLDALSSNSGVATVPNRLTLQLSGNACTPLDGDAIAPGQATITVKRTNSGVAKDGSVTVRRNEVARLDLSPSTIVEGHSGTGTVTLDASARPAAISTTIATSSPSVATADSSAAVAATSKVGTFAVTGVGPGTATITATREGGSVSKQATVTVNRNEVKSLALSPTSVVEGNTSTGTIVLDATALPGDKPITVTSSSTFVASVPRDSSVSAQTDTKTFTVTTIMAGTATITAQRLGGSVSKQVTLTVTRNEVKEFTISPSTIQQGSTATATVVLNETANGFKFVRITTSDPAVATVQSSLVGVTGGNDRTTLTITAVGPGSATITAKREGSDVSKPVTVNVYR